MEKSAKTLEQLQSLTIGRSQECDVCYVDLSVSRLHAELSLSKNNRLYLTDCASLSGTFKYENGQWVSIRQEFVKRTDKVRFGEVELVVEELAHQFSENSITSQSAGEFGANQDARLIENPKRNPFSGAVESADDS